MKKSILAFLLVCSMLLTFALPAIAAEEEVVYLSASMMTSSEIRNANWPITFDKCSYYGGQISVADVKYEHGVSFHAKGVSPTPAHAVFDISTYVEQGYTTFAAIFGKDDGNRDGGPDHAQGNPAGVRDTNCEYVVLVDGAEKARGTVTFGDSEKIEIDVTGASELTLQILYGTDDDTSDCGSFADAKLVKPASTEPEETTPPSEEPEETTPPSENPEETTPPAELPTEDLDLTTLPVKASATRNERWPITFNKCAYYGGKISIAGVEYDKGISTHAKDDDNDPAYVEFDISEYTAQGYKYFSAIFGKDDGNYNGGPDNAQGNPAAVPGSKCGYAVLVDGKVVASGSVEYGKAVQIEVDITGASTLTLQFLTGGDDVQNDCSSYANPKLTVAPLSSGGNTNPTTGDSSMIVVFCFVAVAALGLFVYSVKRSAKKEN